ncbi:ABC transporter ATP-binding protein [Halogeometricum luteum]|uniref:ABC transporter ATP-binding protein n=1 Tax=Halogeometricum luteum TaxID=2950537 RepID=A0ABU2G2H7_9EURY|nr:ABC transporter ATP-binding protein [Halogeometricum sp. S3BR5-2]MDS0294982.1 ABC transporter ATP-binding protein [Halogeometricum sp. S3BR5-2]
MGAIEVDELTKDYGDVLGIDSLTFTVEEGEVFGFLGPNGAGKTTAIRTLLGLQSPTGGSARVLGRDITDERALTKARRDIGYLPAEPVFDERSTGRRLLRYYGDLRGDERSDELLERFAPPLDRKVGSYSRGNKQMLAIVLALMHDPKLIIMDEPTSGLDPLKQDRFIEFIAREHERGKTVFFSSHILSEVQKICERVGIVRAGRLVELEDIETLLGRSGKVVRVRVAERVEPEAFALPGVHDLTLGADGTGGVGSSRSGPGTTLTFTYTGAYNDLIARLSEYDVRDVEVDEAPLEDVFMRFYGDVPADGGVGGDA